MKDFTKFTAKRLLESVFENASGKSISIIRKFIMRQLIAKATNTQIMQILTLKITLV